MFNNFVISKSSPMKKFFLILLIILLAWSIYFWYNQNQKYIELQTNTWNIEKISQLEQQLSWLLEQISWLQAENKVLKQNLSGQLTILQQENDTLKADVEKYKWMIVQDKLHSKNETTNTTTQNNTTVKNKVSYNNTTYNFNLTFPNTRNWYITNTNWNKINVWFNEQMPLFTITTLTHNERSNIQNDLVKPTYLWQNNNYVFVYTTDQDAINQTILNRMGEINNIIQTFQTN